MEKIVDLKDVFELVLSADEIELDSAWGSDIVIPIYDITAEEFLEYAENAIALNTKEGVVNAISNLKRALDCEMDLFFESIKIKHIFEKNNLKFERKSRFLLDIGLLPVHTINKLNNMRNKLEHEYKMPLLNDLRTYYELVWNAVKIIELYLEKLYVSGEISMLLKRSGKEYYFVLNYDVNNCGFKIELKDWTERIERKEKSIGVYLKNKMCADDFIDAFKFYLCSIKFFDLRNVELYKNNVKKIIKSMEE